MTAVQEKTDEELYAILKELPDFDRLPLPKHWYEKFNIPPPKILSIMEAYELMVKTANQPGPLVKTEVRPPADGGVRPLLDAPEVPVEVKHGVSIEDAIETPVSETSERRDSQVHSDLSGCNPHLPG